MRKYLSLALLALFLLFQGAVQAQEDDDEEYKEPTNTLMSEKNYKKLLGIQELMGEEQYAEALKRLQAMLKTNLSTYEKAVALQTSGFVYAQQGKYKDAITFFEQCLALKALPSQGQLGMLYSLASLYMSQSQYQEAIDTMFRWLKLTDEPTPEAYVTLASAYANLEDYKSGLPHAKKANEMAEEPKEQWYQLQLAMHVELSQFKEAVDHLNKMLGFWPDKREYWEMLSGAYQQLNNDAAALAALDLAYERDLLDSENKLINLVRMKLFVGAPYYAGELLEKEIASGRIESNETNLRLLLSAWSSAKEYDKAVSVIDELAPLTDDGGLYLTQAQIYLDTNRWDQVEASVKKALDLGNLKRPCKAHIQLGVALTEQKKNREARQAFQDAARFDRCRRDANSWLAFLNDQAAALVAAQSGGEP